MSSESACSISIQRQFCSLENLPDHVEELGCGLFCTPIPIIILCTPHAVFASNWWLHFSMASTFPLGWGLPPAPVRGYPTFASFGLHEARLYKLASFSCLSAIVTRLQCFPWDFFTCPRLLTWYIVFNINY